MDYAGFKFSIEIALEGNLTFKTNKWERGGNSVINVSASVLIK